MALVNGAILTQTIINQCFPGKSLPPPTANANANANQQQGPSSSEAAKLPISVTRNIEFGQAFIKLIKLYSNLLDDNAILRPLKWRDGEMGLEHINAGPDHKDGNTDKAYLFQSVNPFISLSSNLQRL